MMSSNGKVAIVTGASSGIGKAAARELIERGFRVHAGARRTEAMADLGELGARVHHLDLTVPESIDTFVRDVLQDGDRIDVLVNNAGYGFYGAVEDVPIADARAQMDVNVFGLARMVQLVLPAMRRQGSGRIINVSSIGGKIWSALGAWYHASKFAVEGFSDCLRGEVRPFGIHVIVIEPAGVITEWGDIAMQNAIRVSGSGPYGAIVNNAARVLSSQTGAQSADGVGAVIAKAATARRPKIRYATSTAAKIILRLRWMLSDPAFDWLINRVFSIPKRLP